MVPLLNETLDLNLPIQSLFCRMPRSTMSVLSSSSSSASQSSRNAPLPFTKSLPDFEVELAEPHSPQKSLSYSRSPSRGILRRTDSIPPPGVTPEQYAFQRHVNSLMQAKSRPFSICGHIPIDPKSLTLFFRSQVSSTSFNRYGLLTNTDNSTLVERYPTLARFPD